MIEHDKKTKSIIFQRTAVDVYYNKEYLNNYREIYDLIFECLQRSKISIETNITVGLRNEEEIKNNKSYM